MFEYRNYRQATLQEVANLRDRADAALNLDTESELVADVVRLDRSYRNGLMAGFQFGIIGDEKGYAACVTRYNASIQAAKSQHPAPVAVVLPEREHVHSKTLPFRNPAIGDGYISSWNASLDEVARLNTK